MHVEFAQLKTKLDFGELSSDSQNSHKSQLLTSHLLQKRPEFSLQSRTTYPGNK